MNDWETLLLRGAASEIQQSILPELPHGSGRERAEFVCNVLRRLVVESNDAPPVDISLRQEFETIARGMTASSPAMAVKIDVRDALCLMIRERGMAKEFDARNPVTVEALRSLVRLELRRRSECDRNLDWNQIDQGAGPKLDAVSIERYLRRRYAHSHDLRVTKFRVLPGGRSKQTAFIGVEGTDELPREVVLRQDTLTGVVDNIRGSTTVKEEYPLLLELSKTGTLPVACPLLIEREISEVGAPFMITSRLPGTAPGSWQGFFPDTPRALVESLARLLAAVHTVDFSTLPLPGANRSSEELLEEEVQFRWAKWKRDATSASPIVECAFAWLLAECRSGLGAATLVHGDVLPHNILANQDQVSGLVDWEFAHIGDPAEDLAYCREAVIGVMPWNDFLAVYHAAGGRQVDEHRLAVFSIYGRLRNISFAASAAGAFRNGVSTDFAIGASGCIVPPIYEALIGNALLKYV